MIQSSASQNPFHSATRQLHRFHARAKLRGLLNRVRTPRRRGLVVLSILLACIWLGQAIAGVFLREPANPERLRFWIPTMMAIYCLYHLVKTFTRTPDTPFQWTSAETELLHGAPLTRLQVITYRFRSIVVAAVAKAICFGLIMIPDVPSVILSTVGMFAALLQIDCIRLMLEIVVNAMSERERWLSRIAFVAPVIGLVAFAVYCCLLGIDANTSPAQFSVSLMLQSSQVLLSLFETGSCKWLLEPFRCYSNLILSDGTVIELFASGIFAASMLVTTICAVVGLDHICQLRLQRLESDQWERITTRTPKHEAEMGQTDSSRIHAWQPWHLSGFGPVAWRQSLGAWHYRNAVRFALLIPTLLCCLPMFADANQETMMMNIGGSLVFYTFLLLPSGLILDYRRDIDRMAVLKSLPISPWALTIGQLATPVTLASCFQGTVLTIGAATQSITVIQAIITLVVLLPFNILNFALENYLFMLSPYRRNEEGVMVFVRTILTFTAKGILFAIAFVVTIAWVIIAFQWGSKMGLGTLAGPVLFAIGIWLLVGAAAMIILILLTNKVARFDITIDGPASA